MTERIRIIVDDDELRVLIPLLDELLFKKTLAMDDLFFRIEEIRSEADAVETAVQETVDRLTAELTAIEIKAVETEAGLRAAFMGMDLPTVDRATRMILLRLPGLRDALRTLYQISMLRRTLALGEIRGPLTAIVVSLLYVSMALTQNQRKIDMMAAKLYALEQDMDLRFITMEEAVRGYGDLPERYRTTVIP